MGGLFKSVLLTALLWRPKPNIREVQTGLPEFGTLLAHILPQGTPVDALEELINLFGFIDLEWSHPPGSNRRPADYESAALPAELGWLVFILNSLRNGLSLSAPGLDLNR